MITFHPRRVLMTAAALLVVPSMASSQTGVVEGTISFEGNAPAPRMLEVNKNQEFCGETVRARVLEIDNGRVANAVAHIDGLEGEVGEHEYRLSNKECEFDPPVLAVAAGGTLLIDNQDDVLHNTHLNLKRGTTSRTVGNWALSRKGAEITADRPLRRAGVIEVECDAHSWMHAQIRVFDHPFFDVSDASGSFRIDNVPVGTHTLTLWHEVLGELVQEVTVEAGATTLVELTFSEADLPG